METQAALDLSIGANSDGKDGGLSLSQFLTFPVALPSTPLLPWPATHYVYLRPHEPKTPTAASARSLFVLNVPFDSTPLHFKHLFSTQLGLPAGRIVSVDFHDRHELYEESPSRILTPDLVQQATRLTGSSRKRKRVADEVIENLPPLELAPLPQWDRRIHRPGTNAVVEFVDRASMEAALRAAKTAAKNYDENRGSDKKKKKKSKGSGGDDKEKNIVWGEGIEDQLPPLGKARYERHQELMYPGNEVMKARAEEYLVAYDAHVAAKERILTEQRQMPDEDGFITVTRASSKGGVKGVKQDAAKERLEKQKQKREALTDFYRFQGREKAKQRAKELVGKFQEDVERVRKMRERRGKIRIG